MKKGSLFIVAASAGLALAAYALISASAFAFSLGGDLDLDSGMRLDAEAVPEFSAPGTADAVPGELNSDLKYNNNLYKESKTIIPADKLRAGDPEMEPQ